MTAPVTLSEESIEAIAVAVAERLHGRDRDHHRGLVDAAELARVLGVSRATVYEHADRLGARRLPGKKRSRIRFDLDEAVAAWEARPAEKPRPPARRRKQPSGDLLPVRGGTT